MTATIAALLGIALALVGMGCRATPGDSTVAPSVATEVPVESGVETEAVGAPALVEAETTQTTETTDAESTGEADGSGQAPDADATASAATATTASTESDDAATGSVGAAAEVVTAPGADATDSYAPGSTASPLALLNTWSERRLSWYAESAVERDCGSAQFAEIVYVNEAGLALPVADPPLYMTGQVGWFRIDANAERAAWLVGCAGRVGLHVGDLDTYGGIDRVRLLWLGEGSITAAALDWDDDEVSFSAIGPDGEPFFVEVDVASGQVGGTGVGLGSGDEAGRPSLVSAIPVGATADGSYTWWGGSRDGLADVNRCGEDETTLWVRDRTGRWAEALVDPVGLAPVGAFAIEPETSQVALADTCPETINDAAFWLATLRGDGRLSSLRLIDLGAYVSGEVAQLRWVDSTTVRIDTDNRAYGMDPVSFHFSFADGRDQGKITELADR